jgi:hypothetical protein
MPGEGVGGDASVYGDSLGAGPTCLRAFGEARGLRPVCRRIRVASAVITLEGPAEALEPGGGGGILGAFVFALYPPWSETPDEKDNLSKKGCVR